VYSTIPSVWSGTWTILRSRWQIARNSFWRGKLIRKLMLIALVLFIGFVAYGLYRISNFIVAGLQTVAREQPELLAQIGSVDAIFTAVPSLALGLAALPLLFSSLNFALSTLYLGRDIDLLLVTPVPMRSVFLARFIEGLAPIYIFFLALLAPSLAGYGRGLGYGFAFYAALAGVLLLLPLLPFSIGTLLTMLLARFIAPKRLRDVLAVLGGLFGVLVYIGIQLLGRSMADEGAPFSAEQALRFDVPFLPTAWGARALIAAGSGNLESFLFYGLIYALATAGLFTFCVLLAERMYYNGLASITATSGRRTRRRTQWATGRMQWLRGPAGAIIRKDFHTFRRDIQQLSQLLTPLAFSLFWLWQIVMGTRGDVPLAFAGIGPTATSLFVCILIASNVGLTALSREGHNFWLLHLAPISPWTILWAKWAFAFAPFPILGALFGALVGILQQAPALQLLQSWLVIVLSGIGVAGITTGFGATFPRFDWQNPRKMTSTQAGCLGSLLYFVYAGLMLGFTSVPHFLAPRFGDWIYVAGWSGAIIITALALWIPMQLGANNLRTLEL
jgi:ABC-2 type transport system permease protein